MKKKAFISYIILAATFGILIMVLWLRFDYLLDSDMSSELVLSQLLAEENAILTQNWYYSTELRVLNTQLIYSFFFRIFHDWTVIRTASVAVMLLLLLVSFYYFTKQYHCNEWFAFAGALFLVPVSQIYFDIVLAGAYYIPHILISILSLAFMEHYFNKKKKWPILLNCLLAYAAGLGGPRQLLVLYVPLGMTCIFMIINEIFNHNNAREEKKRNIIEYMWVYGSVCFFSVAGYLTNSQVLSDYFNFGLYSEIDTNRKWIDFSFDRMEMYFTGWIRLLGFPAGEISLMGILLMIVSYSWVVWTIYVLIAEMRKESGRQNRRFAVYVGCAHIVLFLVYFLTDMLFLERYLIPVTVLSIPLMALCLNNRNHTVKFKIFSILLVILTFFCMPKIYTDIMNIDDTEHLRIVEDYLCDNDIVNGYATFWNGNVLTELSNGEIEVWVWPGNDHRKALENLDELDSINQWLQLKSHETNRPAGKVFILLGINQYEQLPWKEVLEEIPYWNVGYVYYLWEFDSYESMAEKLGIE